ENLRALLAAPPPGRIDELPGSMGAALALVRDAAIACRTALPPRGKEDDDAPARKTALTMLDEIHDTAQRMLDAFGPPGPAGAVRALVRDAPLACRPALGPRGKEDDDAAARKTAPTMLDEIHDTAQRMLDAFGPPGPEGADAEGSAAADDGGAEGPEGGFAGD